MTGIASIAGVIAAVTAFIFSSDLSPTSPTVYISLSPPASAASSSPGVGASPGAIVYSGDLSISGSTGINLDTIPPTVGSSTSSTITVSAEYPAVAFSAKVPSFLVAVEGIEAPTSGQCLSLISTQPAVMAKLQVGEWVCARSATGKTASIKVLGVQSSIVVMEVTIWQS